MTLNRFKIWIVTTKYEHGLHWVKPLQMSSKFLDFLLLPMLSIVISSSWFTNGPTRYFLGTIRSLFFRVIIMSLFLITSFKLPCFLLPLSSLTVHNKQVLVSAWTRWFKDTKCKNTHKLTATWLFWTNLDNTCGFKTLVLEAFIFLPKKSSWPICFGHLNEWLLHRKILHMWSCDRIHAHTWWGHLISFELQPHHVYMLSSPSPKSYMNIIFLQHLPESYQ